MTRLSPVPKREFIKRIKNLGLEVLPGRGKGGEWIIRDPASEIIFTMPHLDDGDDVHVAYVQAVMRRFNFDRNAWFEASKRRVRK
jgi:hypothetical protein